MDTKKTYFVILQQEELEMLGSHAKRLVFYAVKSFSANGKQQVKESYLSISKRAGVDSKWVKKCVGQLIEEKWLNCCGEGTKRGGKYPILEVRTNTKLNTDSSDSNQTSVSESSVLDPLSSESPKLNDKQSNKSNEESNEAKLEIQNEQGVSPILRYVHEVILPGRENIRDPQTYAKAIARNIAQKILNQKEELLHPTKENMRSQAFRARFELGLENQPGAGLRLNPEWSDADKLWFALDCSYGWEFLQKEGYLK